MTVRPGMLQALIAAALVAAVIAAFSPVLRNGFVDYDDTIYVTRNAAVRDGLSFAGARWAFSTTHAGNWHPATWLSHMLDAQLFGLAPRGHHLTSVVLHAANAVLLFLILQGITRACWRSALVAALFALHPTRVESVAWVAERKDVLSTFFWFASIYAYVAYTRAPRGGAAGGRYALAAALFALGLLSKPMLVTLPLTLLVLDYWPLGRMNGERPLRVLALEKAPLFALAAVSAVVTFVVQRGAHAVGTLETYGPLTRVANALVATATYLRQVVWPGDLAVFYPYSRESLGVAPVAAAAILIVSISFLAYRARASHPAFAAGWCWFVVTLLPVIGLVQVGEQSRADRYTYVPYVGLFVAAVWELARVAASGTRARAAGVAAICAVAAFGAATNVQARHWRTSETLFTHALRVTKENSLAHNNLGHALNESGRFTEAVPHFQEALRIRPDYAHAHTNLVRALCMANRLDDAARELSRWLDGRPDDAVAIANLAGVRLQQGDFDGAVRLFTDAAAREPENAATQRGLGLAHLAKRNYSAAIAPLAASVRLDPANAETQNNLGYALFRAGDATRAVEHYREALRLRPDYEIARNNLEQALAATAPRDP
ncbi:MAG: tetratricopeptide repeat protein [bacterium]